MIFWNCRNDIGIYARTNKNFACLTIRRLIELSYRIDYILVSQRSGDTREFNFSSTSPLEKMLSRYSRTQSNQTGLSLETSNLVHIVSDSERSCAFVRLFTALLTLATLVRDIRDLNTYDGTE